MIDVVSGKQKMAANGFGRVAGPRALNALLNQNSSRRLNWMSRGVPTVPVITPALGLPIV
jgi:hypothetical protein